MNAKELHRRQRNNQAVARCIPVFLICATIYASWVFVGPLCVEYLLNPDENARVPQRIGLGIALPIVYFCLIPIGTPTASVSKEVASVQRLLKKTGVKYTMHSAGTTLEGPWDQVMHVIGQAHSMLHANGVVRIQSDIRVGSRTDKSQTPEDKIAAVEKLLAQDEEGTSAK